jgi:hypothetical protein
MIEDEVNPNITMSTRLQLRIFDLKPIRCCHIIQLSSNKAYLKNSMQNIHRFNKGAEKFDAPRTHENENDWE